MRTDPGHVAALLITGTVGSGKSTVAAAIGGLLVDRGTAHAVVDLDELRRAWPPPSGDRFNHALELANLGAVAANYRAAGATRLILAGVIEHRSCLAEYEQAVGGTVQIVRLRSSGRVLRDRLTDRHRNDGEGLAWHLSRAPELDAILDARDVADFDVDTTGRSPVDAATEVLSRAGW